MIEHPTDHLLRDPNSGHAGSCLPAEIVRGEWLGHRAVFVECRLTSVPSSNWNPSSGAEDVGAAVNKRYRVEDLDGWSGQMHDVGLAVFSAVSRYRPNFIVRIEFCPLHV